jgi:hypothetical protein
LARHGNFRTMHVALAQRSPEPPLSQGNRPNSARHPARLPQAEVHDLILRDIGRDVNGKVRDQREVQRRRGRRGPSCRDSLVVLARRRPERYDPSDRHLTIGHALALTGTWSGI